MKQLFISIVVWQLMAFSANAYANVAISDATLVREVAPPSVLAAFRDPHFPDLSIAQVRSLAAENRIQTADLFITGLACAEGVMAIAFCTLVYTCPTVNSDCANDNAKPDHGKAASPQIPLETQVQ